jgi:hypothetical protein
MVLLQLVLAAPCKFSRSSLQNRPGTPPGRFSFAPLTSAAYRPGHNRRQSTHMGRILRSSAGLGQQGGRYFGRSTSKRRCQGRCGGVEGSRSIRPVAAAIEARRRRVVLWEAAKGWAELEFNKQRPSIDPLVAFTLGEIEIPALAQERM